MGIGNFHTVIFDLDGTLSDSAILTMEALNIAAPKFGLPVPSEEDVRKATGNANPEFYYILYPDYPRELVEKTGSLVEQEELRILPAVSRKLLFEGCGDLLASLMEQDMRLYIASTGDREHVYSILYETGIINYFSVISCNSPDKTEMLCNLTATGNRKGYVMVGDMKKDYEAARKNNILSVGACFGYCRPEHSDFDFYIDKPHNLLDILRTRG